MGYVVWTIVGVTMLGLLVWLAHRLRMWLGGGKHDRLRSDSQAQSEAEILTRSKAPFH